MGGDDGIAECEGGTAGGKDTHRVARTGERLVVGERVVRMGDGTGRLWMMAGV